MKELLLGLSNSLPSDFSEIRVVEGQSTSIQIQDGKGDKLSTAHSLGAGVRVLKKGGWGFCSTEDISKDSLYENLKKSAELATCTPKKYREKRNISSVPSQEDIVACPVKVDPRQISFAKKMERLLHLERKAKEYAPSLVVNTVLNYADSWRREIVANSWGTYVEQEQIRTRAVLVVTTYKKGVRQSSYKPVAASGGFEVVEVLEEKDFSEKVASRAVELLKAKNAPAGRFTVVLAPSIVGLFAHEALGHNVEADAVKQGNSILEGLIGRKIASENLSIVDNPTLKGAYGSYEYDAEGIKGKENVIIDHGILKQYLHNLETANHFQTEPTGNARASSYGSFPIVRMSNTYALPGNKSLNEIISGTEKGILLEDTGFGGYVFPERGQFMFNANSSWLIEKGKKTKLLKNVSLSGLTLEVLDKVEEVSKEFSPLSGGGMCGKEGQSVPVDDGGPYLKVKDMLVGGQK